MATKFEDVTKIFDAERARQDFPIFSETVFDKPLVYLDSAASAQKPNVVIDSLIKQVKEQIIDEDVKNKYLEILQKVIINNSWKK